MASPSSVLGDVSTHLQKIEQDATTRLDTDLLEKAELFTNTPEYRQQLWKETHSLFLQIASLLPTLQQDPSPLTHFTLKMAEPYHFEHIKDIDFEIGLDLQATPFHGLILTLLGKATANSVDAQALANRPSVMASIVRLWLCTQETGIATQAETLLLSLLQVSKDEPALVPGQDASHMYGHGPMWRRLFGDRDIVSLYYHYTSLKQLTSPPLPLLNKRDTTVAQARLLSWLPQVGALDWNTIVSSHNVELEREIGLKEDQGLLHYAALKMVDTGDDILMHMTLINFYCVLITTVHAKSRLSHSDSSLSLNFMQKEGTHKEIIDFHTSENPSIEHSFLSSRTAQYISDFISLYPETFENSAELPTIRDHVHRNIPKCEASTLNILASMPRSTLIPHSTTGPTWTKCIILDIPITRTNPDALKTLATIFRGPPTEPLTFPRPDTQTSTPKRTLLESTYARLLTALYFAHKPSMFTDITTHMNTIAMKDNALAALSLVRALLTASWSTESLTNILPETDALHARLTTFPTSGLDLVLDPTLSGGLVPALLKPAVTFTNLVGGVGDAEDAAYQVAVARFEVVKVLGRRLEEEGGGGRGDVLGMPKVTNPYN
ncbi:hypothetical protein GQ44DRAFT_755010 [Phaeosphaeriaceae sp. PMI808]|nr:hypothetical protein GQ44DRAFT_755010 [Phaeosphaeriaceae sp. PMI808]